MQIFEQARIRIHNRFLKKELLSSRINRSSFFMDSAATVGILFDGTEPEERSIVLDFAKKLEGEGKKVRLLAFFDNHLNSENFTFKHFNRKEMDWVFRPKTATVREFAEQPFDLLINLSRKPVLPLEYISALSKAKFRVGPVTEKTFCYDLMIESPHGKDLSDFIRQIVFYLEKIKPSSPTGKKPVAA
jgi:hypothetical protein